MQRLTPPTAMLLAMLLAGHSSSTGLKPVPSRSDNNATSPLLGGGLPRLGQPVRGGRRQPRDLVPAAHQPDHVLQAVHGRPVLQAELDVQRQRRLRLGVLPSGRRPRTKFPPLGTVGNPGESHAGLGR